MNENILKPADWLQIFATFALIVVTIYYSLATGKMAHLMKVASINELRPYLVINPVENPYFSYDNNGGGTLNYTLINTGKISANEIVRSYKTFKITNNSVQKTANYINTEYIFSLVPQMTSEIHPDRIEGINFLEKDIEDNSYYIIELRASYKGSDKIDNLDYFSEINIEVHPKEKKQDGSWRYGLKLKYRGEGLDKNLQRFWNWYNSSTPQIINRRECYKKLYTLPTQGN